MTRDELKLDKLELEVAGIKLTLATLIHWMVQSANSPISISEAEELFKKLGAPDA